MTTEVEFLRDQGEKQAGAELKNIGFLVICSDSFLSSHLCCLISESFELRAGSISG